MNSKTIGVWLTIALIGVLLYLLPALMKQLFFMKEQFTSQDAVGWQGEVLADPKTNGQGPSPNYLQNVPKDFDVGGAGGNSLESQPAPIDFGTDDLTPMQQQGMQMKRAPATGPVEAFQSEPTAAPVAAPVSGPVEAPVAAPVATAPSCGFQYNPDPTGQPVYTCNGRIVSPPTTAPPKPKWLSSTTTRDGIDSDEAAIMSWWLSNDNQTLPGWVEELAKADTLTPSEKKAFAGWAKENTSSKNANLIKPTTGKGSTVGTTSGSTTCKPKKPACKPKDSAAGTDGSGASGASGASANGLDDSTEVRCKGPVDLGDYVRKDSIPCWACTL